MLFFTPPPLPLCRVYRGNTGCHLINRLPSWVMLEFENDVVLPIHTFSNDTANRVLLQILLILVGVDAC